MYSDCNLFSVKIKLNVKIYFTIPIHFVKATFISDVNKKKLSTGMSL